MMGNVLLTQAILSIWNMQHQTKVKSNEKNEWACLQENTHARRLWLMEESYEQIKFPPMTKRWIHRLVFCNETRKQQKIVKGQH